MVDKSIDGILTRLDAIEAAISADDDDSDKNLPTTLVADRYAVTTRSVERWAEDPALGFPPPIYINRRKFWSLNALKRFDRECARLGMKLKPPPVHPDHQRRKRSA
jgi:hypothetical protein